MSTADLFDRLWELYDEWYYRHKVIAENEVKLVSSMVSKHPVLEVGVGTGFFAQYVRAEYGLDPSINMLSKALRRGVEVVQGVGERLPFRDSVFGSVLLVVTLCLFDDPSLVLRESARSVRLGGDVVACIVPRDSSWGRKYVEEAKRGHVFYSRARFYTVEEVYRMMEDAGLIIVESKGVLGFKPWDRPYPEEPSSDIVDKGFVCIKGVKK